MADSSQKFIARNRAPRVQIEYDVELYGAEKKVQLPFVMGVMSDLAGQSRVEQSAVADRKFLEIDVDNFDERMKALAPRTAFSVPNTLTGEGSLAVDLTFESMADFSPGAIAAKVDALRPLLEARTQLQNLMAYMDGKTGAEALIEAILNDPSLLAAVSAPAQDAASAAALDSLRGIGLPSEADGTADDVLADLAGQAPQAAPAADPSGDVLAGLRAAAPADDAPGTEQQDALASLAAAAVPQPEEDAADTGVVLGALADREPADSGEDGGAAAALDSLAAVEVEEQAAEDHAGILDGLAAAEQEAGQDDAADAALESLAQAEVLEAPADDIADVLNSLPETAEAEDDPAGDAEDILGRMPEAAAADPEADPDLDDLLGSLADETGGGEDSGSALDDALAGLAEAEVPARAEDDSAGVLAGLAEAEPAAKTGDAGGLDDVLAGLEAPEEAEAEDPAAALDTLEAPAEAEADDEDLDALLAGLEAGAPEDAAAESADDVLGSLSGGTDAEDTSEEDSGGDLAALLGGSDVEEPEEGEDDLEALLGEAPEETAEDLDALLADLDGGSSGDTEAEAPDDGGLDALLGDPGADADSFGDAPEADDLDALLGDLGADEDAGGLDDLLADLEGEAAGEPGTEEGADDDLDALLAGLGDDGGGAAAAGDAGDDLDLDDLLGDLDGGSGEADDLDALLGGLEDGSEAEAGAEAAEDPEFAYGSMSAARPEPQKLERKRFRLAVLGDFSGRAAAGRIETGDALAARRAVPLDPDTVEEVIESFAAELVLPVGKEGAGIAVKLADLDALHPDELFENVELFAELAGLRKQLQSGATADHAASTLKAWGQKYGTRVRPPKRSSAGNAMPADRRLSAFQQLIGDTGNSLREASPVEDLLARVVGPHVRALPDPDAAAMQTAVDEALSDAMRLVLHHPEFQSLEAQWRSLDLMARSIEDDDTLDVMLYDISAEELAADLAAADDLSGSGLVRLLTGEPLDEENGRGGYSALIGMYQFEETPPHAELLGRIARVAAHVDAPFFAAVSPAFLKTPKEDRPRLVAEAWDTLQAMPEAGHLGLVSPRFLLRRPYGEKSEPCYEFGFEEFTESEGLKGMLWANPVVLVAILLARSFKQNGPAMQLGKIMSLGGMPYHYVKDRFGDQVALPCTERNIDLDKIAMAQERGFMAVSAVKGRDELRLTSFNSVKGGEILGPWTGLPAPQPSPPDPRGLPKQAAPEADAADGDDDDLDLSDLGLDDDDDDGDLDDLLSSFGNDDDGGDDGMDAELAALLDDL